jgi:hypothetical protein
MISDDVAGALELAVRWAAGQGDAAPPALGRFIRTAKLSKAQQRAVFAVLDADPVLRLQVLAGTAGRTVSPTVRAWLEGATMAEAMVAGPANRSERRRAVAEQRAVEAERELASVRAQLAARETAFDRALDDAQRRVAGVEKEHRRAVEARDAANHRAASSEEQVVVLTSALGEAQRRVGELEQALTECRSSLARALAAAAEADPGETFAGLVGATGDDSLLLRRRATRRRHSVPSGVVLDSADGVRFLLCIPGVLVVVDGYNVAKQGVATDDLAGQRAAVANRCVELAHRYGTAFIVVFDGDSSVVGSPSNTRSIRVIFSPTGTTADELIAAIVDRTAPTRQLVVVSSDRAVGAHADRRGAFVLRSDVFRASS